MNNVLVKMAEHIFDSSEDVCMTCCADRVQCNKKMEELFKSVSDDKDYLPPLPTKAHCIANIIKFFEEGAKK